MTRHLHLVLYVWASALMLSLTFIIPMTLPERLALIAVVSGLMAMAWRYSQRTKNSLHRGEVVEGLEAALHAARRQPVVLVCGDTHRLFGTTVAARAAVHFTAHACFVQVPAISQLPVITARVAAHPPNGLERLSVMLAISPLDHPDQAHLASQVRAACHQLSLARKAGAPLAFQIVIYLPGCGDDQTWFSWEAGRTRLNVRHVGTCTGVMEWQDQAMDEAQRAQRLRACVQLNSVSQWLAEAVLPHLPVEARCVACSAMLVPELPHLNDANLWHQWLGENIALDSNRRASGDGADRMPFPDTLVALLPPVARHRAARRASVAMLWMFTLAASIALTSSGWQNARLLRQVSADIGLYRALAPVQRPDEPGFALRENAARVLQQHAVSLEDHYRHGVPLSLGLGLYRADRLRAPLLAALADHRSPLPENTDHVLAPIRLNSLSLFAVGSARLKPDSTKVLIQALHRLRAQPGWLIVITGHTDATGPAEHNLQLSRARAEAVRDWMQRMGEIHDSCFAVQGLGASQPIASNDIEVGRSANRRVDIRLVPEAGACLSSPPTPDINPPSHEAA